MKIFPAATEVRFELGLWKLGFPKACNQIKVSYPKLRAFLGPDAIP